VAFFYAHQIRYNPEFPPLLLHPMSIQLRRATTDDISLVAPLFDGYRQFYGQVSNLALAQQFIQARLTQNESVIFIAVDANGQAQGFTQLFPSFSSISAKRLWILNDLFVLPAMRGQQIGRRLLDTAREFAQADGAKQLSLSTAHDNPAQKLYEDAGYVRDQHFYYYDLMLD
jgi:ribosomal protein S18 acetylase RimI-like enzyme